MSSNAEGAAPPPPAFCVVVPMYNEETGVETCVRRICRVLAAQPGRTALYVVNDGSKDATGAILERLLPLFPQLTVITHPKNRGYGSALRTGMQEAAAAGFDYALFMDSDLTNDPDDIPRFAEKMRLGYDVIKATRYSQGGKVDGVPFRRVIVSVVGNRLAHLLFRLPVHDCTNGFRAVRTKLLAQMRLTENKFPIIMEELYWLKFLTRSFVELPVTLTHRSGQHRPTSFVYRPAVFWNYLKWPLKAAAGLRPDIRQGEERA